MENKQDTVGLDPVSEVFGRSASALALELQVALDQFYEKNVIAMQNGTKSPQLAAIEIKNYGMGYIFALHQIFHRMKFHVVNLDSFTKDLEQALAEIYPDHLVEGQDIGNVISTDEALKEFQNLLKTCRKTLVKISGIEEYTATLSNINPNTILLR